MMLVVRLDAVEDPEALQAQARTALTALADRPGWVAGRLGRALDDPDCWALTLEFVDVGSGRRALAAAPVRAAIMPLAARFPDQPCTFETLCSA